MPRHTLFAVMVGLIVALLASVAWAVDVAPLTHDFGEVEVGETRAGTITITNTNPSGMYVWVNAVYLEPGGGDGFAIAAAPEQPFLLVGGESVFIDVAFTPTEAGMREATLVILTDEMVNGVYQVELNGTGIVSSPTPPATR